MLEILAGIGIGAGGVWVVSGVVVFLPLYHILARPHFGVPGRLREFCWGCGVAALAAVLPGGSVLGTAAVLRALERGRER